MKSIVKVKIDNLKLEIGNRKSEYNMSSLDLDIMDNTGQSSDLRKINILSNFNFGFHKIKILIG